MADAFLVQGEQLLLNLGIGDVLELLEDGAARLGGVEQVLAREPVGIFAKLQLFLEAGKAGFELGEQRGLGGRIFGLLGLFEELEAALLLLDDLPAAVILVTIGDSVAVLVGAITRVEGGLEGPLTLIVYTADKRPLARRDRTKTPRYSKTLRTAVTAP